MIITLKNKFQTPANISDSLKDKQIQDDKENRGCDHHVKQNLQNITAQISEKRIRETSSQQLVFT